MTAPWTEWDHVLKIDPDKDLHGDDTFADVMETGTDAIEIGGTLDVTSDKMNGVIEACAEYDVPLYQEPSNPSVVIDADHLDGYLIPIVFNAHDAFWITGAHKEWVRIEDGLPWAITHTEAYVVLNPDSSVADYTDADCDQSPADVAAFARRPRRRRRRRRRPGRSRRR